MDKEQFTQFLDHSPSFSLENFEGPLELLLYLIQKEEVDIYEVAIKELTAQCCDYLEKMIKVDTGADLLSLASTLLLLKSRRLLKEDNQEILAEDELLKAELIEQLIEYCQFKEYAKELSLREEKQKNFFSRSLPPSSKTVKGGLQELSIEDLTHVLKEVMLRHQKKGPTPIFNEVWQVAPKMEWFKKNLAISSTLSFDDVFCFEKSKEELIVLFLALLELMKSQSVKVVRENTLVYICVA